jgi:hypothetical protein
MGPTSPPPNANKLKGLKADMIIIDDPEPEMTKEEFDEKLKEIQENKALHGAVDTIYNRPLKKSDVDSNGKLTKEACARIQKEHEDEFHKKLTEAQDKDAREREAVRKTFNRAKNEEKARQEAIAKKREAALVSRKTSDTPKQKPPPTDEKRTSLGKNSTRLTKKRLSDTLAAKHMKMGMSLAGVGDMLRAIRRLPVCHSDLQGMFDDMAMSGALPSFIDFKLEDREHIIGLASDLFFEEDSFLLELIYFLAHNKIDPSMQRLQNYALLLCLVNALQQAAHERAVEDIKNEL